MTENSLQSYFEDFEYKLKSSMQLLQLARGVKSSAFSIDFFFF